ncbi:hypothetical protein [Vreelandella glaciei]|uniref:helix-hairpin-helix domain-containing protein n=1 Tax=Vreelandella glaciei TaxID=186761 RepID=UPI003001E978
MPTQAANDERYDCIDLNSSDVAALEELPHMCPARAEYVVNGRPWKSANELVKIHGIGQARMQDIIDSQRLCSI